MSDLTQTPTIHAVYSQPGTAPTSTPTLSPTPAASSPLTFSHCHWLPPLPSHFTFPDKASYRDSTLLRCEWADHGYRMNVPHLTDMSVLIDTAGTNSALVERVAAAGYVVAEESTSGSGGIGVTRKLLQLTCHRVVLSTASRVLRTIIHGQLHMPRGTAHGASAPSCASLLTASVCLCSTVSSDGRVCGSPLTYAATSLMFRNCPLVPLLWLLHYLYTTTVVASISLVDLVPTMQLARHFQVLPLLAACEQRAVQLVDTRSLHVLWSTATRLYEGLLLNVCTDFIVANMRDILFCEDFTDWPAFLRECIGGLLHDSQHVVKDEEEREQLIRLFHVRQDRPQEVKAEEKELIAVIDSSSNHPAVTSGLDDVTLTQLIRKQKAQPLFDALTSLCSLYFAPTTDAAGKPKKEADKKAESVGDIAASFGRPPSIQLYADDEDDTDSDSDWDSDEDDHTSTPPSASVASSLWAKQQNNLPTPPSLFGATSPRHRLTGKLESAAVLGYGVSKLSEGLPDLTIETASRPPRHPVARHTRDRSCPLRQEQYVSLMAQHVQQVAVRARRPSAPAIL